MKKPVLLVLACALLAAPAAYAARGDYTLPTEWRLSPPANTVVATGTLPQGAATTADGRHLIVVENGQAAAAVRVYDARSLAAERTIPLDGASGAPLADRSGTAFWTSLAGKDALAHIDAATGAIDRTVALPGPFWGAAIARSPDGKTLAVSGELADAVRFVDEASGTTGDAIPVGAHPFGLAFSTDGAKLYVANWGAASLSVIDTATHAVRATIPVGRHPEALLLSGDGKRLYVSEADDDTVGIVDTAADARVAGVDVSPFGKDRPGASPSALAFSRDGRRLFVAEAAINAVAVVDIARATPRSLGVVPTGWYPTALVAERDGTALDVVNGKGESSRPNPQFAPFAGPGGPGYVAHEMVGSLRRVPVTDAAIARGTREVLDNAPVRPAAANGFLTPGGPIKHVIYVIKENRTYDQVLGDVPRANGDPSLTLFGAAVTPNQHALAARFGVLDATYADAEVSADGHNWSLGAFANDYLERTWPSNYGGRRKQYDYEDGASAATPHNGYLWNAAARAHVSLRNYGEFTTTVAMAPEPQVVSHMRDLSGVTDPRFPGFDLAFSDLDREAEWAREFAAYVRRGDLPQLELVRLPNDHTAGTRPGAPTPAAFVAQNDLAVGRLVATVSHSPYWASTAIFIVEDDAQNGADHVDAQRMTAYVVSAYARGGVVHGHHSTAGIVRTIEALLGLPALSIYDSTATTLGDAFVAAATAQPDLRPFDALPETVDLTATNAANAYRAADSARLDFSHADAADAATLGDIVRHAAR
ncbi:MAG: alkaline phosphatase family protein [Vulcanimicrobiaceae bacterium]